METSIDPSDTHLGHWLGSRQSNVSTSESSATTDGDGSIWGTGSHRMCGPGLYEPTKRRVTPRTGWSADLRQRVRGPCSNPGDGSGKPQDSLTVTWGCSLSGRGGSCARRPPPSRTATCRGSPMIRTAPSWPAVSTGGASSSRRGSTASCVSAARPCRLRCVGRRCARHVPQDRYPSRGPGLRRPWARAHAEPAAGSGPAAFDSHERPRP